MASDYTFVTGDSGSILRVACINDDSGVALDLTGTTVSLKWKDSAGALQTKTMTINSPSSAGVVQYQFTSTELFAPSMRFEILIADYFGKTLTSLDILDERGRTRIA